MISLDQEGALGTCIFLGILDRFLAVKGLGIITRTNIIVTYRRQKSNLRFDDAVRVIAFKCQSVAENIICVEI